VGTWRRRDGFYRRRGSGPVIRKKGRALEDPVPIMAGGKRSLLQKGAYLTGRTTTKRMRGKYIKTSEKRHRKNPKTFLEDEQKRKGSRAGGILPSKRPSHRADKAKDVSEPGSVGMKRE